MVKDFSEKLTQANQRLKSALVGVSIVKIGERLYLQATLPPKPSSMKVKHQQRISLGLMANPAGITQAEKEARKVGALLACREFSWEPYLKPQDQMSEQLIDGLVKAFEKDYFLRRRRDAKSETTWKIDYSRVFARLPQDLPLSEQLIREIIAQTAPDTRTRRRTCLALAALAKFAKIDFDPKPFQGNYSPRKVTPRDLPDDSVIAQWFYKISDPSWRWIYGVLATYGLRPHEVFNLDWSLIGQSDIISIVDGKTGPRRVWPIYPEWPEQFKLAQVHLPAVSGKTNSDLGHRVTNAFRRAKIPFQPYDLRHCWAVRSLNFGLDISLAAQQMGHSVKVHSEIYHHWISYQHHQRAFDALMMRDDRPLPPG